MDAPTDADDDPRNWTIDRVVYELCHSSTPLWLPLDGPQQLIPERPRLENALRENHVDGDSLLTLEMTTLKEDLGIASFGIRNAIMKAVRFFRGNSRTYEQMAFHADSIARMQSGPLLSPQVTHSHSRLSALPQSPAFYGLGLQPSIETRPLRSPSIMSAAGQQRLMQTDQPKVQIPVRADHPDPLKATERPPEQALLPPTSRPSQPRPHHKYTESTLSTSVQDTSSADHEETKKAPLPSAHLRRDYTRINGKKKIAPTFVQHLPEQAAPLAAPADSYLPSNAIPTQDVFYYKIRTNISGEDLYRVAVDDTREFSVSACLPAGQRRVIGRLMKSFHQRSTSILPRSGIYFKLPYVLRKEKSPFKSPYSEQYFTLLRSGVERAKVYKVEDYPEVQRILQNPASSDENPNQSDTVAKHHDTFPSEANQEVNLNHSNFLDNILTKYPANDSDSELPLYGESGDEGAFDEETWEEIDGEKAEEEELRKRPLHLTRDQVEAAIDESITEIKQEWRDTKFPGVQKKGYRHWMSAAKSKSRQPMIQDFNKRKAHYQQRITKIRHEIADNTWRNVTEVKKQCQALELTVCQCEEYDYYGQVLLQDTPPVKPSDESLGKSRAPKKHDLEDGEEILESDPDVGDDYDDDDDDGFIDDSSDVGSIHHDPDAEVWNPLVPEATQKTRAVLEPTSEGASTTDSYAIQETPIQDNFAEDADIETDDDDDDDRIITPGRRKANPLKIETSPLTPTPKRQLATLASRSRPSLTKDPGSSDNSDLDRAPRLPKSRYRHQGRSSIVPVDLTLDSSPSTADKAINESSTDFSVHTPELNPVRNGSSKKKQSPIPKLEDLAVPKWSDVQGMRGVEWSTIDPNDSHRVLAKAIYSLDPDAAADLASFVNTLVNEEKRDEFIVQGLVDFGSNEPLGGIPKKHQDGAGLLILLYLAWCLGEDTLDSAFELSDAHINQAFEEKETAIVPFYDTLAVVIKKLFGTSKPKKGNKRKRRSDALSDMEISGGTDLEMNGYISTDVQEEAMEPSSHKKRKRKVEQSQEAMSQQHSDQVRIRQQEQRRKDLAAKLALIRPDGRNHVIINTEDPIVELEPSIAGRIKPHQIKGIQFMWREIIEDPRHQGCILAHTMGLGKTMQVVSLLLTIALCNHSDNPRVRNLIPEHLRDNKTLILAPASLLNNWEDELLMWTTDESPIGHIYKIDGLKNENTIAIRDWSKSGGILLLGYDRFSRSITTSIKEKRKGTVKVDLETILLEEPTLVIADEAHRLKNPKSILGQLAKRLKTISRIALTGSPLNNHLEEYHTMVNWIAPGYLGDIVQFRAKYSEPIQLGLYSDSTAYEKRLSLRKLHVLNKDLDPKINRADISAIEEDMPSKTEYFITIPLTDLQRQAYDIYVSFILQSIRTGGTKGSNTSVWSWMACLGWLCHHPAAFVRKLKERQEALTRGDKQELPHDSEDGDPAESNDDLVTSDEGQTPSEAKEDAEVVTAGPMSEAMQEVLKILPDTSEPETLFDPALSHRTLMTKRIVEKAVEAGDKTLIFSHSIPTLNYLSHMLDEMKCAYCRIDGETQVTSRQEYTKIFNKENKYMVCLISMRAGGLGLNLQGANRVIIFDFSFNPTWEQQAIGRAYRLNQRRPVYVYRFQAGGTFEDRLFNTSVFKTQLFGRVVDKKNPKRHASKSAHTDYLFKVKDVPQQDFAERIGRDPKGLDAIIHEFDFIRSIVLTETFQKEEEEQLTNEEQKAAEEEYNDQRLQREDPAAWQLKQQAMMYAHQQERRNQQYQHPAPDYAPSSTMPNAQGFSTTPSFRVPPGSSARKSAQYGLAPPDFGRSDMSLKWQAPSGQTAQPVDTPMSYTDDVSMDFREQENRRLSGAHRASSSERDLRP